MPRVQEGGLEAECSPKQVTLGECRCLHVDWNAYGALLAEALRAVEKLVPAVALDSLGHADGSLVCECRPVVRAAAEAAERRTRGEAVDGEGWRAVRMALAGLLSYRHAGQWENWTSGGRRSWRRPLREQW